MCQLAEEPNTDYSLVGEMEARYNIIKQIEAMGICRATSAHSTDPLVLAELSTEKTSEDIETGFKSAEHHRKQCIINNVSLSRDNFLQVKPTVDKLLSDETEDFVKGCLLGQILSHNKPTVYSQSNCGYPQTAERVVGYVKGNDGRTLTPYIMTRLKDSSWCDTTTGEVWVRTDVVAWLPLPEIEVKSAEE